MDRSPENESLAEVARWLSANGHSAAEVEKILARLRTLEKEIQLDSLMDSIGDGTFDLDGIIQAALGE
jgi:hypothetical protein